MLPIVLAVSISIVLLGFLYRYSRKRFLKLVVQREMQREFYAEINRRVKERILLEPQSDEVMVAMLEGENAAKPNAFSRRLDELWEIEHAKMLKEDGLGLPR
ncbi:hypothetical protein [Thiobacillus sp.]